MIEKIFSFSSGNAKIIERIVEDDYAAINHMILSRYDSLPEHNANSNVYMIIIRGSLALRLDDQAAREYTAGNIIAIPYRTRMNISNQGYESAEFFVLKAPSPYQQNR